MTKKLYINPLGEEIIFISFEKENNFTEKISIPFLEFAENFPKILTEKFLKNSYEEIWLIAWPWPFTKMRIISLTINALKISFSKLQLKYIHFFELFSLRKTKPILEANNKEFLSTDDNGEEKFFQKNSLPERNYEWILNWQLTNFDNIVDKNCQSSTFVYFYENPDEIIKIFSKKEYSDFIQPIYIKPPHITYGK